MKLKELHKDISRYLKHDCYCPNEVYDVTGFFYNLVYEDAECKLLGDYPDRSDSGRVFLVATYNSDSKPILLNVWYNDECIEGMERYDLSEQNIDQIKKYWNGEIEAKDIEFSEKDTLIKSLNELMSISDLVMY